MEGMRTASDPLALAQARDLRRAWAETAAVRDRRFMAKQEMNVNVVPVLLITVAPTPNAALLQAKEPEPVLTIPQQLPDK